MPRPLIVADDAAILHKTRHKPSQSAHIIVLARERNIFESPLFVKYVFVTWKNKILKYDISYAVYCILVKR